MSVDAAMEEFWQKTARSTIRERCKSFFNQELLSDVKFVVREAQNGNESKKIPAHKFVLGISSPVFFAMFYGELAETKDSVEISDCDYESLLELFRFIYSDEANLTPDNVMQLLYLAKKYMLSSMVDKCTTYLQENLDASNVFHVLPDAQKYEEKDLLDHCWKVIEKETDEAVKSDGFATVDRPILEELVERDTLTINEVELFKAVDFWAENECEKQGLTAEGSVKRRILGERIVKSIRFPVMKEKEFVSVVLDCNILTQKECFDMMKYFNSVLNTPVGFPEGKRAGFFKIVSRFRSVVYKNSRWNYDNCECTDALVLSVDKSIKLHAVRLFGSDSSEYLVNLTLKDENMDFVASEEGSFLSKLVQSELGDYQGFDIVFKPPVALEANTNYHLIAHVTGPPSWYGQSGLYSVEHFGVQFFFNSSNVLASNTSLRKGQFSEVVFYLD